MINLAKRLAKRLTHAFRDSMTSKVTIRDVAKLARVSVATVSAVINKNKYVSQELEQRVDDAIKQLNYKPNLVARSLKKQETKTIGLIFPNVTSPIWAALVRTAQMAAQQAGYDTFLVNTDEDVEREKLSLYNLLSKRVDGIIISPPFSEDYAHIQQAAELIPLIALERRVPKVECIVTNNEEVAYEAVNHLVGHGYKRIGLVTIPIRDSNAAERMAGYRRALAENDLFNHDLIREVDISGQETFNLAVELLSTQQVDAIFTTSRSTVIAVLQAARHLNRHIPEELAVFGYDDEAWMEVFPSPLSTTRQPIQEMSSLATERLFACLEGQTSSDKIHIVKSSLVIRRSCGC